MLRFSLASLFLLVLLSALGCAALMYASELVKQIAVTTAALVLMVASLMALFGRGRRRALAGGFAFVGWVYLLLASSSTLGVRDNLLTRQVSGWLYGQRNNTTTAVPQMVTVAVPTLVTQPPVVLPQPVATGPGGGSAVGAPQPPQPATFTVAPQPARRYVSQTVYQTAYQPVPQVDAATFIAIGDALWALLLAFLGAIAASIIHARGRRASEASSPEVHA